MSQLIRSPSQHEQLNFLLTNRAPRRLAPRFMGWLSTPESPSLTRWSTAVRRLFAEDPDLNQARTRH